jgi:LemA protein
MWGMTDSFVFWGVLAVVVFWSIGAYNRLMRLRFHATAAFATIDEQFKHYVALVKTGFLDAAGVDAGTTQAGRLDESRLLAGLRGAAEQFDASLTVARVQPLDAAAVSALLTAHQTLHAAWARAQAEPHDLAGSPLPESLQVHWQHIATSAGIACAEFNRRVMVYNEAIAQFPAVLLAWLFGFHAAKPL